MDENDHHGTTAPDGAGAARESGVGATVAASSGIGVPLPHLQSCIYMDYNATTPIFPEVRDAMLPFTFELSGNPSSGHAHGRKTAAAVREAREAVAALVNAASADEIRFVGCGTEADNWAIVGAVMAARRRWRVGGGNGDGGDTLPHVVTTSIEHPAVLECLEALRRDGLCEFTAVGVDGAGVVSAADVAAAIRPGRTVLVTVMHSNNEVGSIQPVAEIAAAARATGALMHSDAAQSVGKTPVDVQALGVDLLTVVGHKFGAPKGVAALYVRRGVEIDALLRGGGQEFGARAGTESVLLIAGLGAAAALARRELAPLSAHMAARRDELEAALLGGFAAMGAEARVNGPAEASARLPNTLSLSVRGLDAARLLADLSDRLAASAAAACHTGSHARVSAVLAAMGVEDAAWGAGTLRLSVGRHTGSEVRDAAALILAEARKQLRLAGP